MTRVLGSASSRRTTLRALADAGLASALGRPGTGKAACRGEGQTCGGRRGRCCNGLDCCGGRCRDVRTDERYCGGCRTACAAGEGQACRAGQCVCPDGRPPCGDLCCPAECSCATGGGCFCPI